MIDLGGQIAGPIHASAVCLDPMTGLLITGPSGSGKSTLALRLIDRGATLIADDRVITMQAGGALYARAPKRIAGLIEHRGLGLLTTLTRRLARILLVVDLSLPAPDRLPQPRKVQIMGVTLPCLAGSPSPSFSSALLPYLRGVAKGRPAHD